MEYYKEKEIEHLVEAFFLQCIFKSLEKSLANVKINRLSAFSSNYAIYSLRALPEGVLIDRKKVERQIYGRNSLAN